MLVNTIAPNTSPINLVVHHNTEMLEVPLATHFMRSYVSFYAVHNMRTQLGHCLCFWFLKLIRFCSRFRTKKGNLLRKVAIVVIRSTTSFLFSPIHGHGCSSILHFHTHTPANCAIVKIVRASCCCALRCQTVAATSKVNEFVRHTVVKSVIAKLITSYWNYYNDKN